MRVLVTGAGRPARPRAGRPRLGATAPRVIAARPRARSTSPTATPCSALITADRSPTSIVHAARLDRGRRLRGRPRHAPSQSTPSAARHVAEGAAPGRRPRVSTSPPTTCSTAPSPSPTSSGTSPNPQSVYGRSKLAGELELGPGDTIVRTSWVCGYHGGNMVKTDPAPGRASTTR